MKKILITGAAGNLGKACVEKFLKEGYSVIATVSLGKSLGYNISGNLDVFEANLVDENDTSFLIKTIIEKHKRIDAALFLVGGFASGGINETNGLALQRLINLNFNSTFYAVNPVFQQMTQQKSGRIIFIGARSSLDPQEGAKSLAYSLSKSLLFQLANCLNEEGKENNVTSTVIVPSTIDTEINRQMNPGADFSKWVKPSEIADAMVYICSDKAEALREAIFKMYAKS